MVESHTEKIVFGGGCFWCVEAVFQMLRGVKSVMSGYSGGSMPNPKYEDIVYSNKSGHAEVVQVEYDPDIVKLDDLLAVFFTSHDPTSIDQQGNDKGPQYRSTIFFTTEDQQKAIFSYIKKLEDDKTFSKPIVTEVKELMAFYPAEKYHQNYYLNNPNLPYCQIMIDPKIHKLREQYVHLLK